MDFSKIYTKTPKGYHLRSSLFGGLSSHFKKVLAHVDGKSSAGEILTQLVDFSESKLAIALSHLEQDGYVKQVAITDLQQVSSLPPVVVEECSYVEEVEVKAEQKAKTWMADEIKARKVVAQIRAKEKAKAEEKELIEAAQIADEAEEAEEENKTDVAQTKLNKKVQFEVQRIAEEKADTQAKLNAEEISRKKPQQQAEKLDFSEHKHFASEDKEKDCAKRSEGACTLDIGKWIPVMGKIFLFYLPLIALLLVGLLHFINLSMLVNPIEKFASESLGEPVKVNEVHASLWPEPHLVLGNVSIGGTPSLKNRDLKNKSLQIDSIYIYPVVSTLFENVKVVNSLEINGMLIKHDDFWLPLRWINRSSKNEHLKIERINFKKIILKIDELELSPFDGVVGLGQSGEFINVDLTSSDHSLSVQVKPQGLDFSVFLTATKWSLPDIPQLKFDEIKAIGTFNENQIVFGRINGNIYGGSMTAKAVVNWFNPWAVTGSFSLTNASALQMLRAFGSEGSIDGKLNLDGGFSGKSAEANKLVDEVETIASFEINNGKINGIDLARTVISRSDKSLAGYATNFDKITGSLNAKNGYFHFRKLVLKSAQLQAQGNVDIQPNQDISGNVSTNLIVRSRQLPVRFNLAGKVSNVKQQ